jgi:hypothetical protein
MLEWYKKYRPILNSSIIHLRRADGRDWDGLLHINPTLPEKGFALFYNPTSEKITRTIKLPLYYTGLTTTTTIAEKDQSPKVYSLNRNFEVELTIHMEPKGYSWFVIR